MHTTQELYIAECIPPVTAVGLPATGRIFGIKRYAELAVNPAPHCPPMQPPTASSPFEQIPTKYYYCKNNKSLKMQIKYANGTLWRRSWDSNWTANVLASTGIAKTAQ